jgi:hypothetical protein
MTDVTLDYRPSCSSLLLRVLFKLVWDEQYIPIIVYGCLRNLLQLVVVVDYNKLKYNDFFITYQPTSVPYIDA